MPPPNPFTYTSLPNADTWMRLLLLLLATNGDAASPLYGELNPCARDTAPPYNPISYCWGDTTDSSILNIRHDGETEWSQLPIRSNLAELLRELRGSLSGKPIRVDAICINQSDEITEKGHQVRNMDKVYRGRDVIIWLGQADESSNHVMDLLDKVCLIKASASITAMDSSHGFQQDQAQDVGSASMEQLFAELQPNGYKALYEFVSRPWFSRRWIVQLYVLSGTAMIWVDNRKQDFEALQLVYRALRPKLVQHRDGKGWKITCNFDPDHPHHMPSEEIDPLKRFHRLLWTHDTVLSHNTDGLTLERLLDNFAGFFSADPRDGIYAFLSLASDIDPLLWLPEYSKVADVVNIYRTAVFHIVEQSGCLDVVCRSNHAFAGSVHTEDRSTWVPWFGPQRIT
ncbi:heterokaryon incompatibility protein-domain-containing protein [Microdochium trichocladiopsis]|uniref:Heterokaryon incompatibility protein-domain-containing protein n=1 Tax=Microdochium trichocladiopsis TaxID=1682393 RepID=A0A9P8YLY2_9PEZI|nr:heterokaryon incompatibility protein-domain-containing protein [Microdochium trichocladiopsis]KAH7041425.1 heterokaryon incompatibility protein-domain-containing protein [Microdochium trichocladiopsis]